MGPRLVIDGGDGVGRGFELDRPVVHLGNNPRAEVQLADPAAERSHARLLRLDEAWVLHPDPSAPTLVNGVRALGPRRLFDGDVLTIGATRLRLELEPAAAPPAVPEEAPPVEPGLPEIVVPAVTVVATRGPRASGRRAARPPEGPDEPRPPSLAALVGELPDWQDQGEPEKFGPGDRVGQRDAASCCAVVCGVLALLLFMVSRTAHWGGFGVMTVVALLLTLLFGLGRLFDPDFKVDFAAEVAARGAYLRRIARLHGGTFSQLADQGPRGVTSLTRGPLTLTLSAWLDGGKTPRGKDDLEVAARPEAPVDGVCALTFLAGWEASQPAPSAPAWIPAHLSDLRVIQRGGGLPDLVRGPIVAELAHRLITRFNAREVEVGRVGVVVRHAAAPRFFDDARTSALLAHVQALARAAGLHGELPTVEVSVAAKETAQRPTCPYCRDTIAEADQAACEGCATPHHAGCLSELGKCTVRGCERTWRGRARA